MKWILCKDALPPLKYNAEMNYWYSDRVLTESTFRVEENTLRSHDGKNGGWGSCLGGQPYRWAYIEPVAP